jgi:CheY-like chemotaxis protein
MPPSDQRPIVLVVEDEALIRMLATDILSEAGFDVLEAAHGKAALDVLESRPDVGMLFSDVDMPLLDGFALARLVAVRWPHVPILITSGKTAPLCGDMPASARFLPKPYYPAILVREINDLLGNRQERGGSLSHAEAHRSCLVRSRVTQR